MNTLYCLTPQQRLPPNTPRAHTESHPVCKYFVHRIDRLYVSLVTNVPMVHLAWLYLSFQLEARELRTEMKGRFFYITLFQGCIQKSSQSSQSTVTNPEYK